MPKKGLFGGGGKNQSVQTVSGFEFSEPKNLIVIPHFPDQTKVDVHYPLLPPYAHAEIRWSGEEKKLVYSIREPHLTDQEEHIIESIEDALREVIDVKLDTVRKKGTAIEYLQQKTVAVLEELGIELDNDTYNRLMYYIVRNFVGLNDIEPLMHDPYIEDIGCNGLDTPVFIVHRRFGSVETSLRYTDPEDLSDFVIKVAERCGRYISYANPLLDGSLPDGSRVQASLARDVTTRGPSFSIRKFRANPYSPIDLINLKTASTGLMAYIWVLAQYNVSMMICGGVSTGKTTFLNAISMFIPPEDKIISIEDTRELNIPHENWVPSVSRSGFGIPQPSGKRYGEIGLFDLLKESFRQNPAYVVVGEVRGKEAYVMFQGMASGHASLGTIHAGSVEDVMKRLETPPIELSHSLIEALDVMVVMTNAKEKGKSSRRVKSVVEIQSIDPRSGRAHTKETFSWIPSADDFRDTASESEILKKISFEQGFNYGKISEEIQKRKKVLEWMQNHGITYYKDVCRLINLYYKDPKTVLEWVRENRTPFTKEGIKKAERTEEETRKSVQTGLRKSNVIPIQGPVKEKPSKQDKPKQNSGSKKKASDYISKKG